MIGRIEINIPVADSQETEKLSESLERFLCETIGDDWTMRVETLAEEDSAF